MTKEELMDTLSKEHITLIKHKDNRDIAFWPTSISFEDSVTNLTGIWYSIPMKDLLFHSSGMPLTEDITIKNKDFPNWNLMEVYREHD